MFGEANRWMFNQSILEYYSFIHSYNTRKRKVGFGFGKKKKMNNNSTDEPAIKKKKISSPGIFEAEEKLVGLGTVRDALPTHFTFEIQSYSLLSKSSIEKYESNAFEAGGYKWKVSLFPNGDKNGSEHISLYLAIAETDSLTPGWQVDVFFRFLLFDQIRDKYLILGDTGGVTRRFHGTKMKWGFSKLLPLKILNATPNGYLVDDTCVFGAEVFVCKSTGCYERLFMVKQPSTAQYTWTISYFSQKTKDFLLSETFNAVGYEWKILLYPKGLKNSKESLSIFLLMTAAPPGTKLYAGYKLRLRNQMAGYHKEYIGASDWFCLNDPLGFYNFLKLCDFNDQTKGFLLKDTCIIEAEVTVHAIVTKLPKT